MPYETSEVPYGASDYGYPGPGVDPGSMGGSDMPFGFDDSGYGESFLPTLTVPGQTIPIGTGGIQVSVPPITLGGGTVPGGTGGGSCQDTAAVNAAESYMIQNLSAFKQGTRGAADALTAFDSLWAQAVNACNNPACGSRKTACVGDRQRGGKFDWFTAYRDPIKVDLTTGITPPVGAGGITAPGNTGTTSSTWDRLSRLDFSTAEIVLLVVVGLIAWKVLR